MKAFTVAFTLVTVLLVSPVFGQQPTDKAEIPPWDGAVFLGTAPSSPMR